MSSNPNLRAPPRTQGDQSSAAKLPPHAMGIGIFTALGAVALGLGVIFGIPVWLFVVGFPIVLVGMIYTYRNMAQRDL